MIRKTIVFIFLIVSFTSASGQISYGLKGGMNLNTLAIKNLNWPIDVQHDPLPGFHIGGFARFKLSGKFALATEMQFIQKGYKETTNSMQTTEETKYKVNYLEFPILITYTPVELVSLEAGPSAAFHLGTKSVSDSGSNSVEGVHESFDFGLTGGLRVNLNKKFSVAARYYYGMTTMIDIFFTDNGVTGEKGEIYNRNVLCSLYYTIN